MTDESNETPADTEVAPAADSAPALRSPGGMIREAREKARISVEELAAQIKLARPTLEALERDDFNQLLEPVYVRGYYRKCSKVLNLSEKDLIDAYHARAMPKGPSTPSKLRLASGTELGSGNRLPVPMAIAFAMLAVFVCVIVWNLLKTPPPVSAPAPMPAPELALPPTEQPLTVDPLMPLAPEGTPLPDTGITPETGATAPLAPATSPLSATPAAPGAVAPAPQAATTTAPPATPAATPAKPAVPAPAPATTAPATTTAPAAPAAVLPEGSVTLQFSESSWARVDDGSGKILLNGLLHAGDTQTLSGKLPFTVFLGNAPVVTVEYEGKAVDFTRRIGENLTARFTVPPRQ